MMLPTPEQTPERKIRSPVIESPSLPVDGGIFHFNAESESEEDVPFNTLFQGKFDAMHNFGFDTTGTPEFSFMDDSEFLVANSMNVPCLASSAYYAPTFEYGSRGRSVFGGGGEISEMSSGSPLAGSTPVSTPVVVDSSMAAAATTTTTTDTNANANTSTSTNTNTNTNGNGSVSGGEMYSGAIKPTVPLWNAQADWNYWDDTFYGSGGDVVFDFGMDMDVSVDLGVGVGVDVLGTQLGDEFDGLRF
ncbi:hypothetical protein PNOK_0653500 [Pyrrhoderma noxium]|uniref:Uncharacterized protein n=1 Tax=Pyrrhoderma noxium TaxID=2282107 RepID=A0A286UEV9_9AGAM|nr:hypothetical protein PNOK_0653500 [Pyrrhoderma noxium]